MEKIGDGLWVLRYPLKLLGLEIGRTVTVIRLASGKLVIHSTARFTDADVAAIHALGEPAWLLDVTRFHDSLAAEGRRAFPNVTYLAPEGFPKASALRVESLSRAPEEWGDELQVRKIDGMPNVQEHAVFHAPSRTLIVADLLFNFGPNASGWTKFVARHLLRLPDLMGTSIAFRLMIRDREAFRDSIRDIMRWDFDRVIVGHGEPLSGNAKPRIAAILAPLLA